MHGYQLRAAFEESTGGTWPLNVGQVYTTLSRLERDDLVRPLPANDAGQRPYEITAAGRKDLAAWFGTPISRTDRPRDELAIKLALALCTPGVDVHAVVQTQRSATMRTLQEYTRLKARADQAVELSWLLVLDAMVFSSPDARFSEVFVAGRRVVSGGQVISIATTAAGSPFQNENAMPSKVSSAAPPTQV